MRSQRGDSTPKRAIRPSRTAALGRYEGMPYRNRYDRRGDRTERPPLPLDDAGFYVYDLALGFATRGRAMVAVAGRQTGHRAPMLFDKPAGTGRDEEPHAQEGNHHVVYVARPEQPIGDDVQRRHGIRRSQRRDRLGQERYATVAEEAPGENNALDNACHATRELQQHHQRKAHLPNSPVPARSVLAYYSNPYLALSGTVEFAEIDRLPAPQRQLALGNEDGEGDTQQ